MCRSALTPCSAPPPPRLGLGVPILSPGPRLPPTMQLEDDIVAKPNYLSTMKNFALQQPSEDWMILEFSQLGFIGVPLPPPQGAEQSPSAPQPSAPIPQQHAGSLSWSGHCSPT